MAAKAEVRPGAEVDLAALVAVLGERHFFTDRLARQRGGGGVLLVAWLDGRPVGDVFLACEPAEEPEVRRYLPACPGSSTWRWWGRSRVAASARP